MEKIFDKEVRQYLLDSGVSETEVNRIAYNKYKDGMLLIAQRLVKAIQDENFEIIKPYTSYSPAGDCMGLDNDIICFSKINGEKEPVDVLQAFNTLNNYKDNI